MEDSISFFNPASFVKDTFLDHCPKSICFGIFDGHGGNSVSNYLVKNLPGVLIKKT